ncbi:hypothetical protein [Natrinema salsiterrestre]|uniref:C2H2-type domain-containing protein n=1 Tax=Natrinema salsiterrestre TaxID=2950540 RepID=A0A9Q4L6K5_9EURY|nr:hypothetical protein [Natrinema salsiterrestre]MDF9746870.1 hypothetical protein [Natrinema salsiterrestre]
MPECEYCDASFEDEERYNTHLETDHYDELGPIDRRRIGAETDDENSDRPIGLIVLGVFLVVAIGVGVFVFLSSSNGSSAEFEAEQQPSNIGSVHTHGTIEVAIDGQQIDFSQEQYQLQADAFHFENGEGTRWHVHAQGVTLEYGMATLGIDVTESTVTFQGTTYRDSDSNTSVTVTVNGESVTPSDYVLREGDRVRIIADRS